MNEGGALASDVLVVIPAYREAPRIADVLASLAAACPGTAVVVVDDGSPDETAVVARASGARVVRHSFNMGYGAAVQTGYRYARERGFRVVVQMDADGQHDPRDVARLASPVLAGACDLALGSRFLEPTGYRMELPKRIGRSVFRALGRHLGLDLTDPTSGFQALGPAVLDLYASAHFPADYPDVDVLVAVHRRGLRIREVPVRMNASGRASWIHTGMSSVYYPYKMLLSLWASALRPARGGE